MNLFMVMLLLTGRAVLAETSSVTDREWLKQQENLSEQLHQHPDKQLQQELEAQINRNPLPKSDRQFIDNLVSQQKAANQEKPAEGRCTLSPSRYLKRAEADAARNPAVRHSGDTAWARQ
uniref:Type-F conjugative transfer system pilin assembly protein TrbC n=1 Tax=Klebsiella pneumoniae TaxID=573 RepID=A0A2P1BNQ4_KLEPN|nr:hypothetical protein [Klebsiella pneumoniae]